MSAFWRSIHPRWRLCRQLDRQVGGCSVMSYPAFDACSIGYATTVSALLAAT
jgi:hypothetical protein